MFTIFYYHVSNRKDIRDSCCSISLYKHGILFIKESIYKVQQETDGVTLNNAELDNMVHIDLTV